MLKMVRLVCASWIALMMLSSGFPMLESTTRTVAQEIKSESATSKSNLKELLSAQPDFHGCLVIDEGIDFLLIYEWARKGEKSRVGRIKCAIQPDCKIENLPPQERVEIRLPTEPLIELWPESKEFLKHTNRRQAAFPTWEAPYREMDFIETRTEDKFFENHNCTVITALNKRTRTPFTFYFANDLNGLLIRVEQKSPKSTAVYSLQLVSLDVSDHLFEVPSDYKELKPKRKR